MSPEDVFRRYQELQRYVGWSDEAAARVASLAGTLQPYLPPLVDDFYAEIDRHPEARKVITGGAAQIERLKGTLIGWLRELLAGRYDQEYVARRWRVGWRHVEIGLDQVYTNVALSRLRTGLVRAVAEHGGIDLQELPPTLRALNQLFDLDLAIIEDAYQAEYTARLQRSERLAAIGQVAAAFRTIIDAAPCMIVILRSDHTIAYFSRFGEGLTSYTHQEVMGKKYSAVFLPEEYHTAWIDNIHQVLAEKPVQGIEWPVLCKDGSRRWMIWHARLLPNYEDSPAVLAVGQDITTLKETQERTLQTERLAAIGQMVTGLAHESGNALARSQACLEMLALEVEGRPEALSLVDRIQKAQNHLQQLYEEVRNYAATLKLEREMCAVDLVWRQAWSNLAVPRQGRQIAFHEESSTADLRCAVDPFRLEQVFRNIFENALAACRDPVEITIGSCAVLQSVRPALRISIRDNGPGLSAEQQQRIFEPFFTTKTKGTGLGMAIAKRIVEAHGGDITVGVCPHPGAEIVITLPREAP